MQDNAIGLDCVITKVKYYNTENGYAVLNAENENNGERHPDHYLTMTGIFLDVKESMYMHVNGNWTESPKYGRQFKAESWEMRLPVNSAGMEAFLGGGYIHGIGPAFAKKIVKKFGRDSFRIIEEEPERLYEIPGVGKKRVSQITSVWNQQKGVREVLTFLRSYGVGGNLASKIYKKYGSESIRTVQNNPYCLITEFDGVGFKTADKIATEMGISQESRFRCESGVIYAMESLMAKGNTCATPELLLKESVEVLNIGEGIIKRTINGMILNKELVYEHGIGTGIYLRNYYDAEKSVASRLSGMNRNVKRFSCNLDRIKNKTGKSYNEKQENAIRYAAEHRLVVLTGGPGTGKTTALQGILEMLKMNHCKVLLAAPTGRAAKRMSEATGEDAMTIHRLLGVSRKGEFEQNEDNPLIGGALIVDECSMIDLLLMDSLLKAVPANMRLVLVGDADQLPSVGPGSVLRDVIASDCFPVVCLTEIFRQAESSRIITNAHRIKDGKPPVLDNSKESDFFFYEEEDPEKIRDKIVHLVSESLPAYYHIKPDDVQVLTPQRVKTQISMNELNRKLQSKLNPSGKQVIRGDFIYRVVDKVMMQKNDYDKEVFNGDIGYIRRIDDMNGTLTVNFDGTEVEFKMDELDELNHAWACTIHKSQGSEYPVVVIPLSTSNYTMLERNLLYTAITRAKKAVVIVGTRKAVSICLNNDNTKKRRTLLSERIRELYNQN